MLFREAEQLSQTLSCLWTVGNPEVLLHFQQAQSPSILDFSTFASQISQKYWESFFSVYIMGPKKAVTIFSNVHFSFYS